MSDHLRRVAAHEIFPSANLEDSQKWLYESDQKSHQRIQERIFDNVEDYIYRSSRHNNTYHKIPRLSIPSDSEEFIEEIRAAVRHTQKTKGSTPLPSSYLSYARKVGAKLSGSLGTALKHFAHHHRSKAHYLEGRPCSSCQLYLQKQC